MRISIKYIFLHCLQVWSQVCTLFSEYSPKRLNRTITTGDKNTKKTKGVRTFQKEMPDNLYISFQILFVRIKNYIKKEAEIGK